MTADDPGSPAALEPSVNESMQTAIISIDDAIAKTGAEYAMLRRHGLDGPARKTLQVLTQLHETRAGMVDLMSGNDPFIALVGEMRVAIGGKAGSEAAESEDNVVSFEAWRAREEALLNSSVESEGDGGSDRPA